MTARDRDQLLTLGAVATRLRISHNEVLRLTREQDDPLPTVDAADGSTYVVAMELTRWLRRRLRRTMHAGGADVVSLLTARERIVLAAYAATGTVDDVAQVLGLTIPEADAAARSLRRRYRRPDGTVPDMADVLAFAARDGLVHPLEAPSVVVATVTPTLSGRTTP